MAGVGQIAVVAGHGGSVGIDLVFGGGFIVHLGVVIQGGGGGANGHGGIHRGSHHGKSVVLAGDLGLLDRGEAKKRRGQGRMKPAKNSRCQVLPNQWLTRLKVQVL